MKLNLNCIWQRSDSAWSRWLVGCYSTATVCAHWKHGLCWSLLVCNLKYTFILSQIQARQHQMLLTIKGTRKANKNKSTEPKNRKLQGNITPYILHLAVQFCCLKVQVQGTVFAVVIETSQFYDQYKHASWWVLKKVQENLSPGGTSWPAEWHHPIQYQQENSS